MLHGHLGWTGQGTQYTHTYLLTWQVTYPTEKCRLISVLGRWACRWIYHSLWCVDSVMPDLRLPPSTVAKENHVIDWSGAKILDREGHRRTRQLKESICICKEANCMNRDAGAYNRQTTYDCILITRSSSTSRDHMPDEVRCWRTKRHNCVHIFSTWLCYMNMIIVSNPTWWTFTNTANAPRLIFISYPVEGRRVSWLHTKILCPQTVLRTVTVLMWPASGSNDHWGRCPFNGLVSRTTRVSRRQKG